MMLLFAYGSHACPYGDWSKEEKLTYVGGLFSCSLQVNFSSILLSILLCFAEFHCFCMKIAVRGNITSDGYFSGRCFFTSPFFCVE